MRSAPAQILVLFAVAIVGLVALVGLVVDASNIYIQRRTGQNAADAAALAGARTLLYTTAPGQVGSISASIAQYATANAFGVQPSVPCAYFVDSTAGAITGAGIINDGSIPSCPAVSSSIPGTASGVHVDTRIAFPTYMMGMFNLMSETAESHATAQVGVLSAGDTRAAPLIACGGGGGTGYDALKLTTQTPVVVTTTPGVLAPTPTALPVITNRAKTESHQSPRSWIAVARMAWAAQCTLLKSSIPLLVHCLRATRPQTWIDRRQRHFSLAVA